MKKTYNFNRTEKEIVSMLFRAIDQYKDNLDCPAVLRYEEGRINACLDLLWYGGTIRLYEMNLLSEAICKKLKKTKGSL